MAVKELVEVYNAGDKEYVEEWQETKYVIPSHGSIKMRRRDAINFLGTCAGGFDKEKRLEIRKNNQVVDVVALGAQSEPKEFVSMKDGLKFKSQEELNAHLAKFADQTVKDERLDGQNKEEVAKAVQCPLCPKSFDTALGLAMHLRTHS